MLVFNFYGCIAQLVEQRPFKPLVGGSSPPAPTFLFRNKYFRDTSYTKK